MVVIVDSSVGQVSRCANAQKGLVQEVAEHLSDWRSAKGAPWRPWGSWLKLQWTTNVSSCAPEPLFRVTFVIWALFFIQLHKHTFWLLEGSVDTFSSSWFSMLRMMYWWCMSARRERCKLSVLKPVPKPLLLMVANLQNRHLHKALDCLSMCSKKRTAVSSSSAT